jgi:hypothetical protein
VSGFETKKFILSIPLEPFQLKAIKDNPYGRIVVDGEICYLSELEYQYKDGIAKIHGNPTNLTYIGMATADNGFIRFSDALEGANVHLLSS